MRADLDSHASRIMAVSDLRAFAQIERQATLIDAADLLLSAKVYASLSVVRNWLDDAMLRSNSASLSDITGFPVTKMNMLFDALAIRSVALNTLISQQRFALSVTRRSADKQAATASPHVARTVLSVPVSRAIADASALCLEKYGEVPAVALQGDTSRALLCVESHVYFIALELLKNALKATVDKHRLARTMPDVELAVGIEGDLLQLSVRDEGSGLSELHQRLAFDWFHSGEPPREPTYMYSEVTSLGDFGGKFTGLGIGLPLSKVYCQFYGGYITLSSKSPSGLTASAVLQRLGDATIEL